MSHAPVQQSLCRARAPQSLKAKHVKSSMVEQLQVTANALCKNRAPDYICQNDSESGNGNGHEWTALPLTPSWNFMALHASLFEFCQTVFLQDSQTVCSVSCSKLRSSAARSFRRGNHLVFGSKGFGEWKIFVALQYPCTHGGIAVSCFTHELPVLPQKQFAILLHLMYCLCKTCLANIYNQPWETLHMPTPNYLLDL